MPNIALLSTAIVLVILVVCLRATRRRPSIRTSDVPAIFSAGSTAIRGDVVGTLVQLCHVTTQVRLKAVSRGLRDVVCSEVSEWKHSQAELACICVIAETSIGELLSAKMLRLPGAGISGHLSEEEGKGVCMLLSLNEGLQGLWLSRNLLGDRGMVYVAQGLTCATCLKTLHADANEVGDDGAVAIATSLRRNRTLHTLNLSENGVGAEVHFRHAGESLGISDVGAKALADCLEVNTALRTLDLASCEIGDEGAHALAACLRSNNTSLTTLDLRCNQMTGAAKEELASLAASREELTIRL